MKKLLYSIAALALISLSTGCETDRYSVSTLTSTPALDIEIGAVAFDYTTLDSSYDTGYLPVYVEDEAVTKIKPTGFTLYTEENMLYTYYTTYRIGEVFKDIKIYGDIEIPADDAASISYIQDQLLRSDTKEYVDHFKIIVEFTRVSNELLYNKYQMVIECPVFEYIEGPEDGVYKDPETYGVNILNTAGISSIKEICDDTYVETVYNFENNYPSVTNCEYYLSTDGLFLWAPTQGVSAIKAYRWLD